MLRPLGVVVLFEAMTSFVEAHGFIALYSPEAINDTSYTITRVSPQGIGAVMSANAHTLTGWDNTPSWINDTLADAAQPSRFAPITSYTLDLSWVFTALHGGNMKFEMICNDIGKSMYEADSEDLWTLIPLTQASQDRFSGGTTYDEFWQKYYAMFSTTINTGRTSVWEPAGVAQIPLQYAIPGNFSTCSKATGRITWTDGNSNIIVVPWDVIQNVTDNGCAGNANWQPKVCTGKSYMSNQNLLNCPEFASNEWFVNIIDMDLDLNSSGPPPPTQATTQAPMTSSVTTTQATTQAPMTSSVTTATQPTNAQCCKASEQVTDEWCNPFGNMEMCDAYPDDCQPCSR